MQGVVLCSSRLAVGGETDVGQEVELRLRVRNDGLGIQAALRLWFSTTEGISLRWRWYEEGDDPHSSTTSLLLRVGVMTTVAMP